MLILNRTNSINQDVKYYVMYSKKDKCFKAATFNGVFRNYYGEYKQERLAELRLHSLFYVATKYKI